MTKSLVQSGYLSPQIVADKASQVAKDLEDLRRGPSLSALQCGAALVTLGYITRLEWLMLCALDISPVPAEDLRSLVKCSDHVGIACVTGDLSTVLRSLQCRRLTIANTVLSTADTQLLVAAMVTRVKKVTLDGDVTLDMDTLAQYDGTGECRAVVLAGPATAEYGDQVKMWAENMGWFDDAFSEGSIIRIDRF